MSDIFEEVEEMEFETVVMIGENGEEVEFSIIDNVLSGTERYLLVVETSHMDEDTSDALLLKEVSIDTENITYEMVEDEKEFDKVAALFAAKGEDYDIAVE